jgi:DNA polymerase-3 subunit gamma/tau
MTLLRMLAFKPGTAATTVTATETKTQTKTSEQPVSAAAPVAITAASREWREILPKLELSGMAYALASNCTLEFIDDHKLILVLGAKHEPMLNPKLKERFTDSLSRYFKKPILVEFKTTAAEIATPAKEAESAQQAKLSGAAKSVLTDPKIKQFIDMYDATVDVTLV